MSNRSSRPDGPNSLTRSINAFGEPVLEAQANTNIFTMPSAPGVTTTVSTKPVDDAAAIASESDDGVARRLAPLLTISSRGESAAGRFRIEGVPARDVAMDDGSDNITGADKTHAEEVVIAADTSKKRPAGGVRRFAATVFDSAKRGRMVGRSAYDDDMESSVDTAASEQQHIEQAEAGGATAVRTGAIETRAFFRDVWGLANEAWKSKIPERRRSRKAKVNGGAITWLRKARHTAEEWRVKYKEDAENYLLGEWHD